MKYLLLGQIYKLGNIAQRFFSPFCSLPFLQDIEVLYR